MSHVDKALIIGVTVVITPIIAMFAGWPTLAFGGFVIFCIAFSKTKG